MKKRKAAPASAAARDLQIQNITSEPQVEALAKKPAKKRPAKRRRLRPRQHHAHLNPAHRYGLVDFGWLQARHAITGRRLDGTAIRVLIALSSRADPNRGSCFPKIETISRDCGGIGVRAVQHALGDLRAIGALEVDIAGGPNGVNLFWLLPAPICEAALQESEQGVVRVTVPTVAKLAADKSTTTTLVEDTGQRDQTKREVTNVKRRAVLDEASFDSDDPDSLIAYARQRGVLA